LTVPEAGKAIKLVYAYYPNFKTEDPSLMVKVWADSFANKSYSQVETAIIYYVHAGHTFPPGIADVLKIFNDTEKLDSPESLGALEAWNLVSQALHNGIYGYQEEYAKLPPLIQETLGAASILKEWAMLDEQEVQTVVASNFQRSYRAKQASYEERLKIPEAIRTALRGNTQQGLQSIGDIIKPLASAAPKALEAPKMLAYTDRDAWQYIKDKGYTIPTDFGIHYAKSMPDMPWQEALDRAEENWQRAMKTDGGEEAAVCKPMPGNVSAG